MARGFGFILISLTVTARFRISLFPLLVLNTVIVLVLVGWYSKNAGGGQLCSCGLASSC